MEWFDRFVSREQVQDADGGLEEMVAAKPGRFYRPGPSASGVFSDWIGVYLDTDDADDWAEVAAIVTEAF